MATKCYEQVRGSAVRVTRLGRVGQVETPTQFAVSSSVASVIVSANDEAGGTESVMSESGTGTRMLLLRHSGEVIRNSVDVNFVRVDPGILSIVAGVPLSLNAAGDVVGFDSQTRRPAVAFAMEVWSRLAGNACDSEGARLHGYTVHPFLYGGNLSGFSFANGLVTFNLIGARTRRGSRWGVGPYALNAQGDRLPVAVSRNTMYQNFVGPFPPPEAKPGVQELTDSIDGGTASSTSSDVIDGQFVVTSEDIIDGGRAV